MLFWDEFPSKISRIYFSKRFRLKNKDVLGFFTFTNEINAILVKTNEFFWEKQLCLNFESNSRKSKKI